MISTRKRDFLAAILGGALCLTSAFAPQASAGGTPTPGYDNEIPTHVMTPNTAQTCIGTPTFVDGVPTTDSAQIVFDTLDFLRGVAVFLNFIPAASLEAIRQGGAEIGTQRSTQAVVYHQLLDSIVGFEVAEDGYWHFPLGGTVEMRLVHIFEMRDGTIARETAFDMGRVA